MRPLHGRTSAFVLLSLAACGSDSIGAPAAPAAVVLSVDGESVAPGRGVGEFGAVYRLTTPAGEPFAFDLVAWTEGASGNAWLAIQHLTDGGVEPDPAIGIASIARAGIAPAAAGMWQNDGSLSVAGDGFARLTLQGRIEHEQVFAVRGEGGTSQLVISIGERSAINQVEPQAGQHPTAGVPETIYSSDSWSFGLPTIAVSGDRTTVVAYEGDRSRPMQPGRYEMRMQHDTATGLVTGGGSVETSADGGNWRDHEIAALYNVLAVARSELDRVRVRLSFDRGATFAQEVELAVSVQQAQTRLVQLAIAADYSLAVVFWQKNVTTGELELKLAEGRPVAFDVHGSPTWYQFGPAEILDTKPPIATPLISGVAWSLGGDLVIGYGASTWGPRPEGGWLSVTSFHCAVRPYGGQFRSTEVDREELVGYDPSVAVLGQGASMRIFYAYEVRAGIRLATSADAGVTFAIEPTFGGAGAHNPTVLARDLAGATAVDVLFLANAPAGRELHHARWSDLGTSARENHRLTTARMELTPPQTGRPTLYGWSGPYDYGLRTTQVGWLGYDAARDGDEIVVCYDEVMLDSAFVCIGMYGGGFAQTTGPNGPLLWPTFSIASPPPLAPGMTLPLPPPDLAHAHQLRLVRID